MDIDSVKSNFEGLFCGKMTDGGLIFTYDQSDYNLR